MSPNQQAVSADGTQPQVGAGIDPDWAWSRYEPDETQPWTLRLVGHLYRRAGFGGNWPQSQRALTEGPQQTIDRLLQHVGRLVETILRSNQFFSTAAYRQRVKSPVEFAVGILRGLEAGVAIMRLGDGLARLGQGLYHPPTIKGWVGGRNWINAATMLRRDNLAADLFSPQGPYGDSLDVAAVAERYGHSDGKSIAKFAVDLFLQGDIQGPLPEKLLGNASSAPGDSRGQRMRETAQQVVCRPEFHLC